jgi:hypothetical protein
VLRTALYAALQSQQQAGQYIVIVQFLAKDESTNRIVVREQGHHILQKESLAEFQ